MTLFDKIKWKIPFFKKNKSSSAEDDGIFIKENIWWKGWSPKESWQIHISSNIKNTEDPDSKSYFNLKIIKENLLKMKKLEGDFWPRRIFNTILLFSVLASFAILYQFSSPLFTQIHKLEENIIAANKDLDGVMTNDSILEKYKQRVNDYRKLLLVMRRAIPNRSDEEQTINFINEYLIQSQLIKYINFKSISFKPKLAANIDYSTLSWPINKNLYKIEYNLSFDWIRNYTDLKKILNIIDKNYRFYEITDINFSVEDPHKTIDSSDWSDNVKTASLQIKMFSYYFEDPTTTK